MLYTLEQRTHTLAQNVIDTPLSGTTGFVAEGVHFAPWKVHDTDGWWTHRYWIATCQIETDGYFDAWGKLWDKLTRVVPRIALVTQCYIEYVTQPILIIRKGSDTALLRYAIEREGVSLMFMDDDEKALDMLLNNSQIPNEFFWYWNDAVNSSGHTSKLLLMLAAVEVLINKPVGKGKPGKDWDKAIAILGPELKKVFWGEEGNSHDALRHRLSHGRYLGPEHREEVLQKSLLEDPALESARKFVKSLLPVPQE